MKKVKFNPLSSIKSLFSRDIGKFGEQQALKYLKSQGLTLITTNFNCRYGELDLIMAEGDVLVFVEVKYRSSAAYGGAINAISAAKQRKLVKTALLYMQQHDLNEAIARFDVVAIDKLDDNTVVSDNDIVWIKNAFYAE